MNLLSNIVPIITFISFYTIAAFFYHEAEKAYDSERIIKANCYIFIGALILCLLAGLRSESVGTDVLVYAKPIYLSAERTDVSFPVWLITQEDIGYSTLAYVSAKLFHSFQFFLFLTEALIVVPFSVIAVINRKKASILSIMLLYMFLYYPLGFNVMRQNISVMLILMGFYLLKKRKTIALISIIVAFLFHSSGPITIGLLCAVYGISNIKNNMVRRTIILATSIIMAVFFVNWAEIVRWLIYGIRILPARYSFYLGVFSGTVEKSYFFARGRSDWVELCFRLINFIIPNLYIELNRSKRKELKYYRYASILNFLIFSVVFFLLNSSYGYRLVMVFDILNCIFYAKLFFKGKELNRSRLKVRKSTFFITLYGLFFWYLMYVYCGMHQIFPFAFA